MRGEEGSVGVMVCALMGGLRAAYHCAIHSQRHDSLSAHKCNGVEFPVEPGGIRTASATLHSTASWHGAEREPKGPTVEPSR